MGLFGLQVVRMLWVSGAGMCMWYLKTHPHSSYKPACLAWEEDTCSGKLNTQKISKPFIVMHRIASCTVVLQDERNFSLHAL